MIQKTLLPEMKTFDPLTDIENVNLILDQGNWPNFHDSEVHFLNLWRGDIRPDDQVWIGPVIEATFELCALRKPYFVVLKFHDCVSVKLQEFNHQNALYDLSFNYEARGTYLDRRPLPPYICVTFEQEVGASLSFKCFRIEALERKEKN